VKVAELGVNVYIVKAGTASALAALSGGIPEIGTLISSTE